MTEDFLGNVKGGIKIFDFSYKDDKFTFDVTFGPENAAAPSSKMLLTAKTFPNHQALSFMDEKVQIHETVMVWLKDEATLISEGWEKRGKTSLAHKDVKFKLGEEKRKLLGSAQTGKIGVTREFEPFFFTAEGWRFSAAEIKMVLKTGFLEKPRSIDINTQSGVLRYDSQANLVQLPNGTSVSGQMLKDLRTLLKFAKLI
jgi:hypothetical protein